MTGSHRTRPSEAGEAPLSMREEQRQLTHRRLIDAARAVFAPRGYGGTSIGDITAAANVNRATCYLHFANKAAALNEIYQDIAGDTAKHWSRMDQALTTGTPSAVREWLNGAIGWWEEHAAILPAAHEATAIEPEIAGRWKSNLDELANELHTYLDTFPADHRKDVRLKIQLLVVQLDQACFRSTVQGVFVIERDHLLDVLTDIWCATLRIA